MFSRIANRLIDPVGSFVFVIRYGVMRMLETRNVASIGDLIQPGGNG